MLKGRRIKISPMHFSDIEEVVKIEKKVFSSPWPAEVFKEQLRQPDYASYFVAKVGGKIIGYAGAIFNKIEAHITNIAINESYRRKKIGSMLLLKLIRAAQDRGSKRLFLELRKSNLIALKFYEKFGFRVLGLRKNYYSDSGEDAVIMVVDDLNSANYKNKLQSIRDSIKFNEV
ncbi:ribosomal protein S18-alanine N-acetyltransferase [Candidatus Oleimmundimicrobium sp.]|uniref:ribosomal protein S18-alanine N-acetyltransferase n=1 Tax=Candidatus Oleimmundimicrobium sp. TaxID=3060597 RepID=UPI00271F6AC7|nr:ribosomal protein S18-alanine N-acetyltransferase [Candidatus Oleimmundimicrobium sp.]MDO8886009.1 ribosomal protein S18-alanine N-acetyltransferase [Candidatus Oleimmundimicrobium sp.]